MDGYIKEIQEGLIEGDAEVVKNLTEQALNMGISADVIMANALIPMMEEIGNEFRNGNIFIPEVLMSSRAMHASLYVLKPLIVESKIKRKKGLVIIGTVAGDLHDIGKNMVSMTLQGDGYEVIDLGIDVPASSFVSAILRYKPDVLAMSALLTTTIGEMRYVTQSIVNEGIRDRIKIVVGGGPVTQDYVEEIGANGYGKDVFGAIDIVNKLLGNKVGYFNV
ncbi:B12-binding domain-containing protein [Acetobacterium carbinolicum]|uniref:cobalamin B12-binding domain-containing protein n=1 Tax=Acetobacterium TaxID=33951 RepID=UPI000DBEBEB5|nr:MULTISPECIES: corrinoid protein [unclassified Acetobacterium]AWW25274.1 cobalamin-binding protein [Acetobacterium sp. KB-1]MDZ5723775.1 corrinoid protein [Acetobacterium sp. K1/6]